MANPSVSPALLSSDFKAVEPGGDFDVGPAEWDKINVCVRCTSFEE